MLKEKWLVSTILVTMILCNIGTVLYFNSQIARLQSIIAREEKLKEQIKSLNKELHSSFWVLAYASWLAIPRNQSRSFDIIVQSISGFAGNVTLSIRNLPKGVKAEFSNKTIYVSPEQAGHSILTITVGENATAGNYDLIIEGRVGNLIRFDLISLTVPF